MHQGFEEKSLLDAGYQMGMVVRLRVNPVHQSRDTGNSACETSECL